MKKFGFSVYIAIEEHTVSDITSNIFQKLRDSEYFIFIDFKRETLSGRKSESLHIGSLFTNQELAIAKLFHSERRE